MPTKTQDAIQSAIQEALSAACTIYVKSKKESWSGSGFHVGNGYVVTASHVCPPNAISNSQIDITFDQKTMFTADIIKSDPNIDAAILHIRENHDNLSHVVLANSDYTQVGDIVAVLGAPEGWSDTATVGRVVNVNQSMGSAGPSPAWNNVDFVDAKILQGVSGGMCIGTDGLVIGSVIGVTGTLADYGIGQNVICPSNKIINLFKSKIV